LAHRRKNLRSLQELALRSFNRELSEKKGYLLSEDFSALPLDQNYWYYAEEDPAYVSRVLREWEKTLVSAIPHITRRLGMDKNVLVTSEK
jgi:hypothetical protein